ncbi:dipeptidyl peptidase 8 isoform X2 [Hydra vulgaris]|uniref:dipeptidyl peptidase 8 isoform X2 n=1 Tax=Hydra vulgaris TaxID=6087 RepID=UPI001F5FBECB|nr:dipeptidyl peptidase 8 isoform X2 [Hydra vulgaris]
MENLSWSSIEEGVDKSRLEQYNLASTVPSNFTFYKTLLVFLGVPKVSYKNDNTLIYFDFENGSWDTTNVETLSGVETKIYAVYQWNLLLDPEISMNSYSKEESLLREHKKIVFNGITSYEFNDENGCLIFGNGNDIYSVNIEPIASGKEEYATPYVIPSNIFGSKMDTKVCPCNPSIISFIHEGDIWVTNTLTGSEMRLTFVRDSSQEKVLSAGVPAYVTQEVFDRFTGYWWEPFYHQDPGGYQIYRILYEVVDECGDEEFKLGSQPQVLFTNFVENYRYPKAGSNSSKPTLKMVEFCLDCSLNQFIAGSIIYYELCVDFYEKFSWVEYIVRCGWMPYGGYIWVQVFNRAQNRSALLRIPSSAFCTVNSTIHSNEKIDVLLEEKSDYWINVSNALHFLPSQFCNEISFIWMCEKTFFKHLYKYTVTTNNETLDFMETNRNEYAIRYCQVLTEQPLTQGEWDVDSETIWLDERNNLVYFLGTKDTPLEKHLYCVSLLNPQLIERMTLLGYSHAVTLNKDCSYAVIVSSSVSSFSQVNLCKINNTLVEKKKIFLQSIGWVQSPKYVLPSSRIPELFRYKNSQGYDIYGMLYKPMSCREGEKYPTMLYVYGGPCVQLVSNSQRSVRRLNLYALQVFGYAVVMLDTMGSCNRGIRFEAVLQNRMGQIEIEQQIEGLEIIAEKSGIIDMNRIVIHGWSYGGYLALMGLAQRPDIFKVAIAGAPVTCWQLYDTGYTERYMKTPAENKKAYQDGSVLKFARQFPNEPNRLMIIHGLMDENVHFSHTKALISELVKEGKPYQLQDFIGQKVKPHFFVYNNSPSFVKRTKSEAEVWNKS